MLAAGAVVLALFVPISTAPADRFAPGCNPAEFDVPSCETPFRIGIAGVELGQRASQVARTLGNPLRRRNGSRAFSNCPFRNRNEFSQRPRVRIYPAHLTVELQRYSYSGNICRRRHRLRQPSVFRVATTSRHDRFPSGVGVGSSVGAVKRAFWRRGIACRLSNRPPKGGYCALAVRLPRWARRDPFIFGGLILSFKHRRVVEIQLLMRKLHKCEPCPSSAPARSG